MSFFRSKDMGLHYLIMPKESAYDIMNQIGQLNCIHFIDSDPNMPHYNRQYYNYMRRSEENIYKIQDIEFQINQLDLPVIQPINYQALINYLQYQNIAQQKDDIIIFEEQEAYLDNKITKMNQLIQSYKEIKQSYNDLHLKRATFLHAQQLLSARVNQPQKQQQQQQQLQDIQQEQKEQKEIQSVIQFNYIAGAIQQEDELRFQRQLFRSTKANSWNFIKKIDYNIEYKYDDNFQSIHSHHHSQQKYNNNQNLDHLKQKMSSFVIIFFGEKTGFLRQKILRICSSFNPVMFDLPEDLNDLEPQIQKIEQQLKDTNLLLNISRHSLHDFFEEFISVKNNDNNNIGFNNKNTEGSKCSFIEELKFYFVKQKALFQQLTLLKLNKSILIGLGWIQTQDIQRVQDALVEIRKLKPYTAKGELQQVQDHKLLPPTHFEINEFTMAFQQIVNTYGVARYKEANPGIFTVITFPFLFGVMFGDLGHGSVLLFIALYLFTLRGPNKGLGEGCEEDYQNQEQAMKQKKGGKNQLQVLYEVRYLLILMAVFSLYCGLIYNEFFSIPLNFFGSCYTSAQQQQQLMSTSSSDVESHSLQKLSPNCTYTFGMDPAWNSAQNHLTFTNSLKMKMSIIIGVVHMTLGILVKGSNAIYHHDFIDFFFEFLPQLFFMTATFGYLCILIFMKWATDYTANTHTAPSLLSMMINFIIGLGQTHGINLYGEPGFQEYLQVRLLIIAVICVPLMLLPKPLINYAIYKRQFKKKHVQLVEKNGHHLFIDEDVEDVEENNVKNINGQNSHKNSISINNIDLNINSSINISHSNLNNIRKNDKNVEDEEEESKDDENPYHTRILHDAGMWLNPETKHFNLSQEFVHQSIESIEFVLGCVSNTASYLRLWALSLAHSQLSEVFFNKTILSSLETGNAIGLVIGFNIFAQMTFGILMCMDTMECFLHTLRLHWVEFQSKFYKGDGYTFRPFSFIKAMQDSQAQELNAI